MKKTLSEKLNSIVIIRVVSLVLLVLAGSGNLGCTDYRSNKCIEAGAQ